MIYTLTSMTKDMKHIRCFGFFYILDDALKSVEQNSCNMIECLYEYLVVEAYDEGIHPISRELEWFYADNNEWKVCEKPKNIGCVNLALG